MLTFCLTYDTMFVTGARNNKKGHNNMAILVLLSPLLLCVAVALGGAVVRIVHDLKER